MKLLFFLITLIFLHYNTIISCPIFIKDIQPPFLFHA